MKIKLLSIITILFIINSSFGQETGEELFKVCKACHNLSEDKLIGPGLEGVLDRRERSWLKSWITSSTKFIASGDVDAKALFEEYKIPMADYNFSDIEMNTLLDYIGGKETVIKVEEIKSKTTTDPEILDDKKLIEKSANFNGPSSFSKAFEHRPVFKFFFWMSVMLLLATLLGVIHIYRDSKKNN